MTDFSRFAFELALIAEIKTILTTRHPGHQKRCLRPVRRRARYILESLGYTWEQIRDILNDCMDMAVLEIESEDA